MISYFRKVFHARYILSSLVRIDLKGRYRNSIMGFAWNFLTPLGLVVIIGTVFSLLFSMSIREFVPYLFSGLIPWFYVVGCADGGSYCFLGNQGYIKQMSAPIEIYPLRLALVNLVNLLMSIGAFWLICIYLKPEAFNINMLGLVPAVLIFLFFGAAWATLSGFIHLYVRDFAPLQSLAIQALFYVTPIIYPAENILSTPMAWLIRLNPLYYLLEIIRKPLLGEPVLVSNAYIISVIITFVMFMFALVLYKRIGRKIAYKL